MGLFVAQSGGKFLRWQHLHQTCGDDESRLKNA
jgi:hypothetical protein